MTDTPPPTTRPSAQFENPLFAERRARQEAERQLAELRVQLTSLRPPADRAPLSRRVVETVQAMPPIARWTALLTATAAVLGAVAAILQVLMPTVRELIGLAAQVP